MRLRRGVGLDGLAAMRGATIGALGDDIRHAPWRGSGLPGASLRSSPAL